MQHKDFDWKELRGSIILFLICLGVGGSMLYGSLYFKKTMQQEFARNDARFKTVSQRYLAVDEEERLIKEYFPAFIELYNNGVIGREQRLNWIEVLRETSREMNLPRLNYQIESQSPYTPGYSVNTGKFKLFSSRMNLDMSLLHEGDLFRLFETLGEEAKGIFSPTTCNMRGSGEIKEEPRAGNITANCELQWYTIRLADGTEISI